MLSQIVLFHSFLWLSSIPLYIRVVLFFLEIPVLSWLSFILGAWVFLNFLIILNIFIKYLKSLKAYVKISLIALKLMNSYLIKSIAKSPLPVFSVFIFNSLIHLEFLIQLQKTKSNYWLSIT